MIQNRLTLILSAIPHRRAAAAMAARWQMAAAGDPELIEDLIRLGGVLAKQPAEYAGGIEKLVPIDPVRMARNEGRREMAVDLLAMMNVTPSELATLMETETNEHP
jgi:hypothetical protein